jgi:hypothetical protein
MSILDLLQRRRYGIPNSMSLEALERAACAAHASVVNCVGGMLEHGMRAGDILIDIMQRGLVHHGDKKALFERTCGSQRVGQLYVQLAANRHIIDAANTKCDSQLTIADALRLVRKPRQKNSGKAGKPSKNLPALQSTAETSRELQARAMQDVGSDSRSEADRLRVSLEEKSFELQRLLEEQTPAKLIKALEQSIPHSNRAAHKHLRALAAAISTEMGPGGPSERERVKNPYKSGIKTGLRTRIPTRSTVAPGRRRRADEPGGDPPGDHRGGLGRPRAEAEGRRRGIPVQP